MPQEEGVCRPGGALGGFGLSRYVQHGILRRKSWHDGCSLILISERRDGRSSAGCLVQDKLLSFDRTCRLAKMGKMQ